MTVCVAAICNRNAVIGAADRMLTGGDIEFEPSQPKIALLTTAISGLFAGDAALTTEIMWNVVADINQRIRLEPQNWWLVRDVAALYSKYYKEARFKRAESAILAPLGLDGASFIARQKELAPDTIEELVGKLTSFATPGVEAILAGVDLLGPHIYVANGGDITCHDVVGFAAIGAGYWHADSQFMFANHTGQRGFAETLLLTYSAKRRAEVAPGVGKETDMVVVGPQLGTNFIVGDHVIRKLGQIYETTQGKAREAARQSEKDIGEYVTELTKSATAKPQEIVSPVGPVTTPATPKIPPPDDKR